MNTETTYANATPAPPAPSGRPVRDDGAAWLGIVLIVLGGVFLTAQLVPGLVWWQLWPLAIVAAGVIQAVVPSRWHPWSIDRFADGIGTALLGVVLLGNTTGYVPWSMWWTFFSLWPVLLIAAGIGIIGKATQQGWIRFMGSVVVWATLLYSASTHWLGAPADFMTVYLPFLQ